MTKADKHKQGLYFSSAMLAALRREAARLDRSFSWVVQRCVKVGMADVKRLGASPELRDERE